MSISAIDIKEKAQIPALVKIAANAGCAGTIDTIKQFYDDSENEERLYDVYRVFTDKGTCILKKSDKAEISIYKDFLEGHSFSVPRFYGSVEDERGVLWLLMEDIAGTDLREYSDEIAVAAAKSITQIHRFYWNTEIDDGRFTRYMERIRRRALCLKDEPELQKEYERFIERQPQIPRTLCSGDFLQYNAIYDGKKVTIIDWAFGGVMPYSLDAARMIAHGTENRFPFPFYMTDKMREEFLSRYFGAMKDKLDGQRFKDDLRLACLNECIEFIERELLDPTLERDEGFGFYYSRAKLCIE